MILYLFQDSSSSVETKSKDVKSGISNSKLSKNKSSDNIAPELVAINEQNKSEKHNIVSEHNSGLTFLQF